MTGNNKALMRKETLASIVLPVYNEEFTIATALAHLYQQCRSASTQHIGKDIYEIIIVNNNSSDHSIDAVNSFSLTHPDMDIVIINEPRQGVAWARKTGMDLAVQRSHERDARHDARDRDFYIFSTDADCLVEPHWLVSILNTLRMKSALAVCRYTYPEDHFHQRPNLLKVIRLILKARDFAMRLFGGFPDGKGFALPRSIYEQVKGIDIFYQVQNGGFICHLSDDWDFGIKIRALGHEIIYVPESEVSTNPRRIDHALDEMIQGTAYGRDGIIGMPDIRPKGDVAHSDISDAEARLLYEYSIKDFTTKHIILPVLLTPELLNAPLIAGFLSRELCDKLARRIADITAQMRVKDFSPIHLYKTPCYRLYFEFRDELFARMRVHIDENIGYPPPLPECLNETHTYRPHEFRDFVYYYCEDRESGEAHNYFGNGGVF